MQEFTEIQHGVQLDYAPKVQKKLAELDQHHLSNRNEGLVAIGLIQLLTDIPVVEKLITSLDSYVELPDNTSPELRTILKERTIKIQIRPLPPNEYSIILTHKGRRYPKVMGYVNESGIHWYGGEYPEVLEVVLSKYISSSFTSMSQLIEVLLATYRDQPPIRKSPPTTICALRNPYLNLAGKTWATSTKKMDQIFRHLLKKYPDRALMFSHYHPVDGFTGEVTLDHILSFSDADLQTFLYSSFSHAQIRAIHTSDQVDTMTLAKETLHSPQQAAEKLKELYLATNQNLSIDALLELANSYLQNIPDVLPPGLTWAALFLANAPFYTGLLLSTETYWPREILDSDNRDEHRKKLNELKMYGPHMGTLILYHLTKNFERPATEQKMLDLSFLKQLAAWDIYRLVAVLATTWNHVYYRKPGITYQDIVKLTTTPFSTDLVEIEKSIRVCTQALYKHDRRQLISDAEYFGLDTKILTRFLK